jgi:hypothetical protein
MALAYGLVVTVAFTNRAAVPFWSNTEHLRFVQIKKNQLSPNLFGLIDLFSLNLVKMIDFLI